MDMLKRFASGLKSILKTPFLGAATVGQQLEIDDEKSLLISTYLHILSGRFESFVFLPPHSTKDATTSWQARQSLV